MNFDPSKSLAENLVDLINVANPNLGLTPADVSINPLTPCTDNGDGYNTQFQVVGNPSSVWTGQTTLFIQRQDISGNLTSGFEDATKGTIWNQATLEAAIAAQFGNLLPGEYTVVFNQAIGVPSTGVVTANDQSPFLTGSFTVSFNAVSTDPSGNPIPSGGDLDTKITVKQIGKFTLPGYGAPVDSAAAPAPTTDSTGVADASGAPAADASAPAADQSAAPADGSAGDQAAPAAQ